MLQEFLAIALGQVEIEQENIGTLRVHGLGELIKKGKGLVGILDDLEVIGQRVSREHPLDGVDVCRIIFDGEDGQRGERCQSIHDGGSCACCPIQPHESSERYKKHIRLQDGSLMLPYLVLLGSIPAFDMSILLYSTSPIYTTR